MATITVRRVDAATWEPLQGSGQGNFISDIDAVAQIIAQRLKLFEGEWWADVTDGLPLWQGILGYGGGGNNQAAINLLIQERILNTPFVISLSSIQSAYNSSDRSYTFYAVAETVFGPVAVTNQPTVPNQGLPS